MGGWVQTLGGRRLIEESGLLLHITNDTSVQGLHERPGSKFL